MCLGLCHNPLMFGFRTYFSLYHIPDFFGGAFTNILEVQRSGLNSIALRLLQHFILHVLGPD